LGTISATSPLVALSSAINSEQVSGRAVTRELLGAACGAGDPLRRNTVVMVAPEALLFL